MNEPATGDDVAGSPAYRTIHGHRLAVLPRSAHAADQQPNRADDCEPRPDRDALLPLLHETEAMNPARRRVDRRIPADSVAEDAEAGDERERGEGDEHDAAQAESFDFREQDMRADERRREVRRRPRRHGF